MWDKRRISSRQKLVLVRQIKYKHNVLLITVSKGAFKTKQAVFLEHSFKKKQAVLAKKYS